MDLGFAAAEILVVGGGVGHGVENGWISKGVQGPKAWRRYQRVFGARSLGRVST
jgi:hypothetical protein